MFTIELNEHGIAILKLEINPAIAQESFFGSHLLTKALVELIEQTDVSGWEKHPDSELQPDAFYAAIVSAIAANVKVDLPEGVSLREAMIDIVDDALTRHLFDDTDVNDGD